MRFAIYSSLLVLILSHLVIGQSLLNQTDKDAVLSAFNKIRTNVQPPASNMQNLTWSTDLEALALNWTETCQLSNDPSNKGIRGQIFLSSPYINLDANLAAEFWNFEAINFDYSTKYYPNAQDYTQIIWATTTSVGCAMLNCGGSIGELWNCVFYPRGNYPGVAPYQTDCVPTSNATCATLSCGSHFDGCETFDCGSCTGNNDGISPSTCIQYMGCYQDTSSHTLLPSGYFTSSQMNVEICRDNCLSLGYSFAGLESGSDCYCGNSVDPNAAIDSLSCITPCVGNQEEYCGGFGNAVVYYVGSCTYQAPTPTSSSSSTSTTGQATTGAVTTGKVTTGRITTGPSTTGPFSIDSCISLLGCFQDGSPHDLIGELMVDRQNMTVESCTTFCAHHGYNYAGIQFGQLCFCGNSYGAYGALNKSACNTPCSGNAAQPCGALYINSIYSIANCPHIPPATGYWDWRSRGVVTPVKDQGGCGACWAFSTAEAIESVYAINHGVLNVLSPQNLVDCDRTASGCDGGYAFNALQYIESYPLDSETSYPYVGKDGTCKYNTKTSESPVTGYQNIAGSVADIMNYTRTVGPVITYINGGVLQNYGSGVLKCTGDEYSQLDHFVVIVGYGTDPTQGDYWLIRNSWSATWGEAGYARISRGLEEDCGITYQGQTLVFA